jgi:hypothetical protein
LEGCHGQQFKARFLEKVFDVTALALEVVDRRDPTTPPPSSLDERITATLASADAALPFAKLRACCRSW